MQICDCLKIKKHTKWRILIPDEEERNETCPRPSDEILLSVKKQKSSKAAAKRSMKAAAKRSSTAAAKADVEGKRQKFGGEN